MYSPLLQSTELLLYPINLSSFSLNHLLILILFFLFHAPLSLDFRPTWLPSNCSNLACLWEDSDIPCLLINTNMLKYPSVNWSSKCLPRYHCFKQWFSRELYIQITWGDFLNTSAKVLPQRFCFNWSGQRPGHQYFSKFSQPRLSQPRLNLAD